MGITWFVYHLVALQFGTFSALKIRDGWPKAQEMGTD